MWEVGHFQMFNMCMNDAMRCTIGREKRWPIAIETYGRKGTRVVERESKKSVLRPTMGKTTERTG